jgi:hypothetical protein
MLIPLAVLALALLALVLVMALVPGRADPRPAARVRSSRRLLKRLPGARPNL